MQQRFEAVKVTERVYWVGAIDWALRDFHGYATHRGSTYNAYLILAEKITLVDTVKSPFMNEMLARIASLIDPATIDYIISNHSEMDHTGCLPEVIDLVKPEKVFASVMGVKALNDHFDLDYPIQAVADGQTLSLGNMNVTFVETRMLHWPDSMVTYLAEEEILFSQDGFGMHLASSERFDDELDKNIMESEAAKYYANILMPYSSLIAKLLLKIKAFPAPIKLVAPDHGPIWRKNFAWIMDLYGKWSQQRPTLKAVVTYDTMWQSTAMMARQIAEGISAGGGQVKVMPLSQSHRSDVATEVLEAGALLVGSPTINNNMFPTVADLLCYLKGLKPANLAGAAFGSYGWGKGVVKSLTQQLEEMKVELLDEGICAKYRPDDKTLQDCRSLGLLVAKTLKEKCNADRRS